jgi:hypothetical protein
VIAVDHTSLSLLEKTHDPEREKDFGAVGSYRDGARGLHAVTALSLSPDGVPLGVGAARYWSRPLQPHRRTRRQRALIKLEDNELGHWAEVIAQTRARYTEHAPERGLWFQLDRGGDSWRLMWFLHQGGYHFTVRARANRCVLDERGEKRHALDILRKTKLQGVLRVAVSAQPDRTARLARLHVRAAPVTLVLRNPGASRRLLVPVYAVWVREQATTPKGEEPIEWLLWTRQQVRTFDAAAHVVRTYALRWRIEDFHKTWKSGACNVEDMRLHGAEQATKWATVLAAVAARIERLKHLARNEPDQPASIELNPYELQGLILLKRRQKKRTEQVCDSPTIAQAVRWIADLGGYTGQRSAGPPGSIVIGRGLEKVCTAASLLEAMQQQRNPR